MAKIKSHPLNIAVHAGRIKNYFPESIVTISPGHLVWKCTLTPSPLSNAYKIKMVYKLGSHPNIYVEEPKLALAEGKTKLPHVYSTKKQWLCIYYRSGREWNSTMQIADTVIPWACEWLLHYEYWLATGKWHGKGIDHSAKKPIVNAA